MYLIRRVFRVKPGAVREAAKIVAELGKGYEKAGRSPTRVYWSGYTVPGPANTVYMDWTEETLRSPFDPNPKESVGNRPLYEQLDKLLDEGYGVPGYGERVLPTSEIEFYEMV